MKSTFDEARERIEGTTGTEYIYGAVEKDLCAVPLQDRLKYLPDGVLQFNGIFDSNGCSARGIVNIAKAKFNYFYANGMHPDLQKWLLDNGYVVNGKIVFDETFIEILSGTKPNGNSLKSPVDTVYRCGLIPECLPLEPDMTWEQYMNPARITQKYKDLGKEFLRRFGLNYEQVPLSRFTEAIKDDYLDVATHAWPQPINGVYPKTEGVFNHVVARCTNEIDVLDNYQEFIKRLAPDYLFFGWAYSLSVTRQTPNPVEQATIIEQVLNALLSVGLGKFFPAWLADFLKPQPTVPAPKVIPPKPMKETSLERIAEAAIVALGTDVTPTDAVPDEVACVASLVAIVPPEFGLDRKLTYTPKLFDALSANPKFKRVKNPSVGTIVVSPTKGNQTGHCGIYVEPDGIASNNSFTNEKGKKGTWTRNYTRQGWINYFGTTKGLNGYLFDAQ